MIDLVVLDMAGTTIADDGLVIEAFQAALPGHTEDQLDYVQRTMGESKISVFRAMLGEEAAAQRANLAFEEAYGTLVRAGRAAPIAGAANTIAELREAGIRVALTTGFARTTADALLAALGWQDIADLTLTPAEAGRGRPYPDLVLTALLRLQVDDVRAVAVVGDTSSDVLTGLRAGASFVGGVLTGAHDAETLRTAGATHILNSVRELPDLLL
ncbi:phosphonatase-like hydrolase [Longispora fulva]|uniref:Phosphonatase-like hydrolase n=1 Tax=Longispora fulva TaxID=619741 RepID=A0A8J7GXH5_9ACTN|nr:phosphonatase-like hydrolase [Longispora fulva]MBG6140909.1 phosphonatase-like hydrolase [Longispora fulva]